MSRQGRQRSGPLSRPSLLHRRRNRASGREHSPPWPRPARQQSQRPRRRNGPRRSLLRLRRASRANWNSPAVRTSRQAMPPGQASGRRDRASLRESSMPPGCANWRCAGGRLPARNLPSRRRLPATGSRAFSGTDAELSSSAAPPAPAMQGLGAMPPPGATHRRKLRRRRLIRPVMRPMQRPCPQPEGDYRSLGCTLRLRRLCPRTPTPAREIH